MTDKNAQAKLVCVGAVSSPHGVHGRVKIRSYTEEPEGVVAYGPVYDATGTQEFAMRMTGMWKSGIIVTIDGVKSREEAEALKGVELFVHRDHMPEVEDEDEFYQTDLIGLRVKLPEGRVLGEVKAVVNYGAGDLIEVRLGDSGKIIVAPFTADVFPKVDPKSGQVLMVPPVGLLDEAKIRSNPQRGKRRSQSRRRRSAQTEKAPQGAENKGKGSGGE